MYASQEEQSPSRKLTYPILGEGKSFSKVPWSGICYFLRGYIESLDFSWLDPLLHLHFGLAL